MPPGLYEEIGRGYANTRRADPRIARAIGRALGDAREIVNVGAGSGSYEPADRRVLAVEPAAGMRAQRPVGAAPCLAGAAERLPLPDASADAAMAIYTDFHWRDRAQGIAEMVRVSRDRVVLLTVDREVAERFWLTRDYLPGANDLFAPLGHVTELLPTPPHTVPVPIPHDCHDGFVHAFWKRPQALLDPRVRATMSLFARLEPPAVERGLARLGADLESGAWRRRNRELLGLDSL
ncbi:MAG TPA: methyltransferase domain-containing protein, partial [Solirubrobacteraceae bacterium]|nr:methyltransferase domain-containing protein [Solirubrobacteraceae bacterium]